MKNKTKLSKKSNVNFRQTVVLMAISVTLAVVSSLLVYFFMDQAMNREIRKIKLEGSVETVSLYTRNFCRDKTNFSFTDKDLIEVTKGLYGMQNVEIKDQDGMRQLAFGYTDENGARVEALIDVTCEN